MSTNSLLGCEVVYIRPGDSQSAFFCGRATRAGTALFDGSEVFSVGCVAEIEGSCSRDGVAKALSG